MCGCFHPHMVCIYSLGRRRLEVNSHLKSCSLPVGSIWSNAFVWILSLEVGLGLFSCSLLVLLCLRPHCIHLNFIVHKFHSIVCSGCVTTSPAVSVSAVITIPYCFAVAFDWPLCCGMCSVCFFGDGVYSQILHTCWGDTVSNTCNVCAFLLTNHFWL